MATLAAEAVPTSLTTVELRLPLTTEEIRLSISPLRRIVTANPEEVFLGAAHHYNRQAGEMDGAVGAYLTEGIDRGLFDATNQDQLHKGIAVMLNKVNRNPVSAREAAEVVPEMQLDYMLTTRRRWLAKNLLSQAFATYEYEFDYFGFFRGVDAHPTPNDAGLNDFLRWEFNSVQEASVFGERLGGLIGGERFNEADLAVIKNNSRIPDIGREEMVQAAFSLFLINQIFPAQDTPSRAERRISLAQLGLPTELCAVRLSENPEHSPLWNHVGKFMTDMGSGFLRSHKQLWEFCRK